MGNDQGRPPHLEGLRKYLGKSLAFYNMKAEILTPTVFVAMLLIGTVPAFLPEQLLENDIFYYAYDAVSIVLLYLLSSVYLAACLAEFTGVPYTAKGCVRKVAASTPVLLGAYVLFTLGNLAGLILLIVPGIIFYIMSMFYTCFILDKGAGVLDSIRRSWRMTSGRKLEIFAVVFAVNLILTVPFVLIFIIAVPQDNVKVYVFVTTFMLTLFNLVQQRLNALLYLDLAVNERQRSVPSVDASGDASEDASGDASDNASDNQDAS